ncbi:MAG: hypothetical protein ACUVUB_07255 [Candidatus Bathyarchaeia archaeon]
MPKKIVKRPKHKIRRVGGPRRMAPMDAIVKMLSSLESRLQESIKVVEAKTADLVGRAELESRMGDLQSRIYDSIPRLESDLRSLESKLARAIQKSELEQRLEEIDRRLNLIITEIEALKGRVKDLEIPNV